VKDWLKRNEILSPLRKGQSGSSINTIAVHSGWCFCLRGFWIQKLLSQSEFWAVHLWQITKGPIASGDGNAVIESALGVSSKDAQKYYSAELCSEDKWPYIHIALSNEYSAEVEWSNFPEDFEIHYQLCHPEWAKPIVVGVSTGHWRLPALSWREIMLLSKTARKSNSEGTWTALFLMLPGVWLAPSDDKAAAQSILGSAAESLKLFKAGDAAKVAVQLTRDSQYDFEWRQDERLGWINNSQWSLRNPDVAECLSPNEFQRIKEMFTALH
jgi:hypothetical protein